MVSFGGQKKLGPRPDWSPIGVSFKISDEHPHPFHMGSPPPGLFTVISNALQRESFAGLVGGMTLKCENRIGCYTARYILFFNLWTRPSRSAYFGARKEI